MGKTMWRAAASLAVAGSMAIGLAIPASASSIGESGLLTTFDGSGGTFAINAEAAGAGVATRLSSSQSSEGQQFLAQPDASGTARWELVLPSGADAFVIENEQGVESVVLTNADGDLLGGIATPEGYAATTYAVEGDTVVQTLAEPQVNEAPTMGILASTEWYRRGWVTTVPGQGYIVNADPTALGREQVAWSLHYLHVRHLKTILGDQAYRVNYNIEQQFVCHVAGAWTPNGVYNMESWRPELYWQLIFNPIDRCNRN